jgi:hypothetical protein
MCHIFVGINQNKDCNTPSDFSVNNGVEKTTYEERNDLYCSPNIVRVIKSRRVKWAGHVARMGEMRGVYRVLVGNPEGKRSLVRPSRIWEG